MFFVIQLASELFEKAVNLVTRPVWLSRLGRPTHHGRSFHGSLSLLLLSVVAAAFRRSIALSGGSQGSGPHVHFVTPGLL